jgi:hypothetical protein
MFSVASLAFNGSEPHLILIRQICLALLNQFFVGLFRKLHMAANTR